MDYNQLLAELARLGVPQPPDILRASIYLPQLQAAKIYFDTTLDAVAPGGLGPAGYLFVANAVRGANLLQELAAILDFYISPAVNADLERVYSVAGGHGPGSGAPWTYRQYFDGTILDANPVTYQANVAAFMVRYPIASHAITQLYANFIGNVKLCCERVYADRALLVAMYNDRYNNALTLYGLTRITSSGSDFHKGGKQVLILTFNGSYRAQGGGSPPVNLKVVYKPGDLETDCLIAGDSAVVNRVLQPTVFMANSLFEIFNAQAAANPGIGALPLKTYRILPRNYNSAHGAGLPLPIRDAYGYIEFLNYGLSWGENEWWGFYPDATSDYVIFQSTPIPTVSNFYRRAGAFCALASAFSIVDMHFENFRISNYDPYPIDLELSLTASVNSIQTTSLITGNDGQGNGALNGVSLQGQDSHWVVRQENNPGRAYLERDYPVKVQENRLYNAGTGRAKTLVRILNLSLFEGYNEGMQVLQAAQTATAFDAWFLRLNNVVVRFLPFATPYFKEVITNVFINQFDAPNNPNAAFAPTLQAELLQKITQYYNTYVNGDPPRYLAFQPTQSGVDYTNLDIPVFYYLIAGGSMDIVNSTGAAVPIPATVAITGNPTAPCAANVGRGSFFAAQQTDTNVRGPQVTALGMPVSYQNRFDMIQGTMLAQLGLVEVPAAPQVIIPF